MRNLLEEFNEDHGVRPPTILGVREHIFTGRSNHYFIFLLFFFFFFWFWLAPSFGSYNFFLYILHLWCSVSSLAWFMSNQETSFVTIGQRVLARPLKYVFSLILFFIK